MSLRLVIPSRGEVGSALPVEHPWWRFSARFNVAISQNIPLARMHEREREGVMVRWGLALESTGGGVTYSTRGVVRCDTLRADPELRTAWLNSQRGIVPVAGFYLWQRTAAGHHQPYYVRLVNRMVFGLAALWERAETNEGEVLESCALIAVDANPLVAEIDNITAQMPAILRQDDQEAWLTSNVSRATGLLQPYSPLQMVCHPVAPRVNDLEFDEPGLIRPAVP
ncbi:MAG: SOS response-associated peptidase [Steroidobacteraceae bacterium]